MSNTYVNLGQVYTSGADIINAASGFLNSFSGYAENPSLETLGAVSSSLSVLSAAVSASVQKGGAGSEFGQLAGRLAGGLQIGSELANLTNALNTGDTSGAMQAGLGIIGGLGGVLGSIPIPATQAIGTAMQVAASLGKEGLKNGWFDIDGLGDKQIADFLRDLGGLLDVNPLELILDFFIPSAHGAENPALNDFYLRSRGWRPRIDPLALDLDGDGLETVGITGSNPVLFDHDGDGTRSGTGWLAGDDAFLALDKNGNGSNGQTGTLGELTTGSSGNLDLTQNPFYREFTPLPLTPSTQFLPDLHGAGAVRDLRETANDWEWRRAG
jgi:hypothetical protein